MIADQRSVAGAVQRLKRMPFAPEIAGVAPAIALSLAYLLIRPASQDFASGDFRARLFREGSYVWNLHWFGGHPLPGYGLVSPLLSGVLGVVPVAILSLIVASWAFGRIITQCRLTHPTLPAPNLATAFFSVGCGLSLWGGRLTFGPAVAFGALCMLFLQRERTVLAIVTALLCGLSSPVGALSLALIVAACFFANAFPRKVLIGVGAAAVVPAGIIGVIFPEGGWYPFPAGSFLLLSSVLACIGWFGRHIRVVRMLAIAYAVVATGSFLIRSPLGGNVVRLGWLAAAPVAILTFTRFRRTLLPIFVVITVIWGWSYVKIGLQPADASSQPQYYDSLANFVAAQPGGVQRVEVVPTETFRQADELALKINIARGWETQLDRELNPELYTSFDAATYHNWLLRNSVSLVALPATGVQPYSHTEQQVIQSEPSYLHLIWSTSDWKVYQVTDSQPLADNGATVTKVGTETMTIEAPKAGTSIVRFRYSKWFRVTSGHACISESPDGWLQLDVQQPGTIIADVGFSIGAATGDLDQCN